jgi:hypothetical protein
MKLEEENIGAGDVAQWNSTYAEEMPQDIRMGKALKAQETKTKTDKWDYIKLKSFCTAKEVIKSVEISYKTGENLCSLYI